MPNLPLTIASVAAFAVLPAISAQSAVIINDTVEGADGWNTITAQNSPRQTFDASIGGPPQLTPKAGSEFFTAGDESDFVHAGIHKSFGIVLQPGTYTYTFNVGKADFADFLPDTEANRISVGFFNPATADTSGTLGLNEGELRNAIKAFHGADGITYTEVQEFSPEGGNVWATWTYSVDVDATSPLIGTAMDFGFAINTGGTPANNDTRVATFDNLQVEYVPEPSALTLTFAGVACLLRRSRVS